MRAISKEIDSVLKVEGKSMGATCVSPSKTFTTQQQEYASQERKISASLFEIAKDIFECVLVPQSICDILTGSFYWHQENHWYKNYQQIGTIYGGIKIYYSPLIQKIYFGETIEDIDKLITIEQRKKKLEKLNTIQ